MTNKKEDFSSQKVHLLVLAQLRLSILADGGQSLITCHFKGSVYLKMIHFKIFLASLHPL